MLDDMTKEELLEEVKKMRSELYHMKMAQKFNLPPNSPRPDGYAYNLGEAPPGWALPTDRSGQVPSVHSNDWPKFLGKPWLGAIGFIPDDVKEEVLDVVGVETPEVEGVNTLDYSGWCLRTAEVEGEKFIYLRSPDGRSLTRLIDYRAEVSGTPNRPQVLYQFANVLGQRDIPATWPRWWKMERVDNRFILSRNGVSYVIEAIYHGHEKLWEEFFQYLNATADNPGTEL